MSATQIKALRKSHGPGHTKRNILWTSNPTRTTKRSTSLYRGPRALLLEPAPKAPGNEACNRGNLSVLKTTTHRTHRTHRQKPSNCRGPGGAKPPSPVSDSWQLGKTNLKLNGAPAAVRLMMQHIDVCMLVCTHANMCRYGVQVRPDTGRLFSNIDVCMLVCT
jgi:hypothetical protein